MQRYFLIFILVILVLAGLFLLTRRPTGISTMKEQKPDVTVQATELYRQFVTDEAAANELFLNKVLAVSGTVASVSSKGRENISVLLQTGSAEGQVRCRLDPRTAHRRIEFNKGENVTFKGVCAGYIGDVELVQCVED